VAPVSNKGDGSAYRLRENQARTNQKPQVSGEPNTGRKLRYPNSSFTRDISLQAARIARQALLDW